MKRRPINTVLSMVMCACLVLCFETVYSQSTFSTPPNVIVILLDDMGCSDLSCFGNTAIQTPAIDQLAAQGLRFRNFYTNAAVCSPSRCSLTTGQYPQRWRITSYLAHRQFNRQRGVANWLDPSAPTLPRLLHQHGYRTGHFGKWHLGGQRDVGNAPLIKRYGFDKSLTNFEGLGPRVLPLLNDYSGQKPKRYSLGSENLISKHAGSADEIKWVDRDKVTGEFVEAAMDFIRQAELENRPFYVNIWPDDVHSPHFPSEAGRKGCKTKRDYYFSVLKECDAQLKPLFDYVQANNRLRNNTIILLMGDNGPENHAGTAEPFIGGKTCLYEGGIRSSLVVWAPGMIPSEKCGSMNTSAVFSCMDLVPSILSICGFQTTHSSQTAHGSQTSENVVFDGEDFSSVITGRQEDQPRNAPLMWRVQPDMYLRSPDWSWRGWQNLKDHPPADMALRDGKWKFLTRYDGSFPQLYDLDTDPSESCNLADQHPEYVHQYTQTLNQWNARMPQDASR